MQNNSITSIPRSQDELRKLSKEVFACLQRLCVDYDNGNTYSAVLIAVVLRTILKQNNNTISVLKHLSLENKDFLDTRIPRDGICFWQIGSGVSNHFFLVKNVYGGLLKKCVNNGTDGKLILDFEPLKGDNKNSKQVAFDDWYNKDLVFENSTYKMTRSDCINCAADKDGGAHLDKNIPVRYADFREPFALQVVIDGKTAVFNQNPVYVTIRQIAWEVLETLKTDIASL